MILLIIIQVSQYSNIIPMILKKIFKKMMKIFNLPQ